MKKFSLLAFLLSAVAFNNFGQKVQFPKVKGTTEYHDVAVDGGETIYYACVIKKEEKHLYLYVFSAGA